SAGGPAAGCDPVDDGERECVYCGIPAGEYDGEQGDRGVFSEYAEHTAGHEHATDDTRSDAWTHGAVRDGDGVERWDDDYSGYRSGQRCGATSIWDCALRLAWTRAPGTE